MNYPSNYLNYDPNTKTTNILNSHHIPYPNPCLLGVEKRA